MAIGLLGHIPPLFGIGGTLILLFFIGILWLWAKERIALKGVNQKIIKMHKIATTRYVNS